MSAPEATEIIFSDQGRKDFLSLDEQLQRFFKRHLEKLSRAPLRRHLKFGVPHHVEDVTRQARLVYDFNESQRIISVIRCFSSHKDYERWYNSFK